MQILWTSHLKDQKEKEDFKLYVKSSGRVLDRLKQILKDKQEAIEKGKGEEDYKNPSWAYLQADRNGAKRVLEEIISLITLDK